MDVRKVWLAGILVALLTGGCRTAGAPVLEAGDLAVKAWESGSWKRDPAATEGDENFVFEYETTAWKDGAERPFHQMKTVIRLRYDPDRGEIDNARVTSLEPGYAFRHVCFTPAGPVLRIRVITNLDDRPEDLTVIRLEGPMPAVSECVEVGVGPWEGLVEVLDVLFEEDGTYSVMKGTGAHLAGAGVRMERRMTTGPGAAGEAFARYP